jgi:sensor domain CHASE-containing protein
MIICAMRRDQPFVAEQAMSILRRTLVIILLSGIAFLGLTYLITQVTLAQGYRDLEQRDVRTNLRRVSNAITAEVNRLVALAQQSGPWDDTYLYVQGTGPDYDYVAINLTDVVLTQNQTGFVMITDEAGQVMAFRSVDLSTGQAVPPSENMRAFLLQNPVFVRHPDEKSTLGGVWVVAGQSVIIASVPVLNSLAEGPIKGAFIVGRYLDNAYLRTLSQATQVQIEAYPSNAFALSEVARTLNRPGANGDLPLVVRAENDATITGYTSLSDGAGQPTTILQVEMPRVIYQQGQTSLLYYLLLSVAALFATGLVLLFFIRQYVLRRVARLNTEVGQIGVEPGAAGVTVEGRDELSALGKQINTMLRTLDRARLDREQLYRRVEKLYSFSRALTQGLTARDLLKTVARFAAPDGSCSLMYAENDEGGQPRALVLSEVVLPDDRPPATIGQRFVVGEFPLVNLFLTEAFRTVIIPRTWQKMRA